MEGDLLGGVRKRCAWCNDEGLIQSNTGLVRPHRFILAYSYMQNVVTNQKMRVNARISELQSELKSLANSQSYGDSREAIALISGFSQIKGVAMARGEGQLSNCVRREVVVE